MSQKMQGKHVIVFGGVTGIGFETVRLLVEEGAKVAVADLNADGAGILTRAFGDAVLFVQCDVSREDQVRDVFAAAIAQFGPLSAVINNAGIQFSGEADHFDLDAWNTIMAVNAGGAFLVAKHAIPYLKKVGGGSIVITASTAGIRGGPGMSAYSASKGAIVAFGRSLAMELGPHNIRVNVVCPGWTDTAFNGAIISQLGGIEARDAVIRDSVPMQRQAQPSELAGTYLYLASDASTYTTGQSIVVDGGLI